MLVVLDVTGTAGNHPDHIHRSTCADPEPNPLFPLTDVVLSAADQSGHSESLVNISLANLLADPHLILIHKSAQEIDVYVACGDITREPSAARGGDESDVTTVPKTGVGSDISNDIGLSTWAMGAGALLAVFMAWTLQKRRGA